jgi:hypothetical protein
MGMVMVKCPQTGRAIPTGIKTDRDSFRRSPVFFGRSSCPICHSITPGSHGKPGLTSRAPGRGVAARAPWPDHPHRSSMIAMGDAMAHIQISAETIYDSAQRIRRLAHEFLELVRLRDKVRRAEARQEARGKFDPRDRRKRVRHELKIRCRLFRATLLASDESLQANRPIKARTYLDGTQLGMRSGTCWKC